MSTVKDALTVIREEVTLLARASFESTKALHALLSQIEEATDVQIGDHNEYGVMIEVVRGCDDKTKDVYHLKADVWGEEMLTPGLSRERWVSTCYRCHDCWHDSQVDLYPCTPGEFAGVVTRIIRKALKERRLVSKEIEGAMVAVQAIEVA